MSKTVGEKWEGGEQEGGGVGREKRNCVSLVRLTPPSAPYFSHSLLVSFPLRKFLETPATQAERFSEHQLKQHGAKQHKLITA